MPIDKARILNFMAEKAYRPLKIRELAKGMKIPEEHYRAFRRTVRSMLQEGSIVKIKKNRLGLPEKLNLVVGKLTLNKSGFGFVQAEDGKEEVYINKDDVGTAWNGDKVVVRIYGRQTGKSREGTIIKILERANQIVVGTFKRGKHFFFVQPDDKRFTRDIYIPEPGKAEEGQKVVVSLEEWQDKYLNPEGKIQEVLGYPDDPGVDILTLIREYQLPVEFPGEIDREAEKLSQRIPELEYRTRVDFRDNICFTIDPWDAKDHDDAVSLEKLENGNYLLGVHIADVSYYVKENTRLDKEAFSRGNSIYLADRVIPMLPEKLSNQICSLRPKEEKLTYSCLVEIDPKGKVIKYRIVKSLIQSRAKLNYDEVQAFFDTGKSNKNLSGVEQTLKEMLKLSQILHQKRIAKGSLDFDLPEAKVLVGKDGRVLDIFKQERLESHRLIEEFMLLANQCVAKYASLLRVPFLYRVHDQPDKEKIENFAEFISTLGYKFPVEKKEGTMSPKRIQRFLKSAEGTPQEELINELLLRSLKKACYQPENIGHFGLAFSHYTHFTSPIRRYPDLLIHRLLKELEETKNYIPERRAYLQEKLPFIGKFTSDRERLADEVEQESIKLKQIEYLKDRLGEHFSGIISGILPFGFFVRLDDLLAEGLVRLSSMEDDYYRYDEKNKRLVGRHSRKIYNLGERVKVQLIRVNKEEREIDFNLISETGAGKLKKRKRRSPH
ncbi:MAG: ribonuclease R [candidate division Zixibacteria bacterium]|nr:ribonuclease R [candidate division Zixibacteria bacterium]